jgi:hypothetical protein
MSYNPNLSYFLSRLQGVAVNYFRLEPQASGSSAITANKIIRFSLPSNCLLNTRSLSFHFNADANAGVSTAGGRLPADISSLIDRVELSSGGVQIAQGANGYNRLVAMKRAMCVDKCDPTLGHPEIVRATSYVDGYGSAGSASISTTGNESYSTSGAICQFAIHDWEGFIGSVQPAIIDTSLLSDLTLTIYLAGNEVISSSAGVALQGTGSSDLTDAGSLDAGFQIRDFHLTCETIALADSVYDMMIEKRISDVGFIELPYKAYYSFTDTHSGTTRFTVATQSLDRVWTGFLQSSADTQAPPIRVKGYKKLGAFTSATSGGTVNQDIGIPEYDVGGVLGTNAEKYRGKYFTFTEDRASSTVPPTYQFNFNGSMMPQFRAQAEQMLAITRNSVPTHELGMGYRLPDPMSLDQYKTNFFVMCVRLNLPESEENREISGADTRGISLNAYLQTTGFASSKPVFIVCETTATLRIGSGRAIEVIS